jgi:recombination protein RecA
MSLTNARKLINKKYEKEIKEGDLPYLTFETFYNVIPRISTGSLWLDDTMGGGMPRGKIMQFYGPESGGKTTLTLFILQTFIRSGLKVAFFDAENAFDPVYAKKNFDFDITNDEQIFFSQEENLGRIYAMCEILAENGIDIIVLDSADATMTNAESKGEMDDAHMGQKSRLHSQGLNKLKGVFEKTGTNLIIISQIRDQIGGMGESETTAGGHALKHYCALRFRISRKEWVPKIGDPQGIVIRIKNRKNKVGSPYRACELTYMFDTGFVLEDELVVMAAKYGVIKKAGSFYNIDGEKFQGLKAASEYLQSNIEKAADITDRTIKMMQKISVEVDAEPIEDENDINEKLIENEPDLNEEGIENGAENSSDPEAE